MEIPYLKKVKVRNFLFPFTKIENRSSTRKTSSEIFLSCIGCTRKRNEKNREDRMKKWLLLVETSVLSMAGLRFLSATIELSAAILMLLFNDVKKAIAINSMLAIVGPIILITTMTIGLLNIADELSFSKLIFIAIGVGFILIGIYK
jgi:hypothetical protein